MRLIFFIITILVFLSCNTDEESIQQFAVDGLIIYEIVDGRKVDTGYRRLTSEQRTELINKGWINPASELELRAVDCSWADGYGGTFDCIGNYCEAIASPVGWCIGCYTIGDDPAGARTYHGSGECRE